MLFAIIFACGAGTSQLESKPEVKSSSLDKEIEPPLGLSEEPVELPEPLAPELSGVDRPVYFTNKLNFQQGQGEFLQAAVRSFSPEEGPQAALEQLYKGPKESEEGLVLTNCESTGATLISVNKGLAYVQLQGGCGGCGAHSVYDALRATLIAWPDIDELALFASDEQIKDTVTSARRPRCLEP